MFKKFLWLEWKAFTRAASLGTNIALKILMGLVALYFIGVFLALGIGVYFVIDEHLHQDPLVVINKFMIYYMAMDLVMRVMLQKIPIINIRPLLVLPIKRSTIVNFALAKTFVSFFTIMHVFFFVPFSIVLIMKGYDPLGVALWWVAMWAMIYCNNLLNILINNKDSLFIGFIVLILALGGLQYYGIYDITLVTGVYYQSLFSTYYVFIIPVVVLIGLWVFTHKYFIKKLYLDTGLKGKNEIAETQDFKWLNRFGSMAVFLKNDIKLILRNKRSKTTVIMSVLFIFYGLLFYTGGIEVYDNQPMKVFASIFVTGGFLLTFGQFVPSWDSAYYPLMMSQNIQYREYIASKWWLMVIGTVVSAVLASFYLYFGIEIYLMILAGAVFNIGVNSLLVLLGGAFVKTPIDLTSSKQAFGDKKAFNIKTFIISLPKMLVPIALFVIGNYISGPLMGYGFIAGTGLLGLIFRNAAFRAIERIYKAEKYSTLSAYKQKN
ncbi:DUF5687 family protein [Flavobacterium subsaxonicum]|uniref:Uncharacterized protein n=1 Tax=Flavobacterium subsaxonicum WB 4.1-42 = DSM 21790 TaxID=1121898 RepID=A0A0A2MJB1_9FLAO|nr:DUF5687 family protein [Flavobacterium subsaxonicum]KGO92687.1 hypothetical protein Q766_11235 [Flavobacterium subsaxonicum WB 4.1-42 = DSM 21790]